MDESDVKIVQMLQQDGRMQYNEIAKRLGLANATVHARIIKLRRQGIIEGFSVNVSPASIGKPLSFLLSLSVDHSKDTPEQAIKRLLELDDVVDVFCVTGDWDYHVLFYTKDVDSMKALVTDVVKQKVPHIIRSSAQLILGRGKKPIAL